MYDLICDVISWCMRLKHQQLMTFLRYSASNSYENKYEKEIQYISTSSLMLSVL